MDVFLYRAFVILWFVAFFLVRHGKKLFRGSRKVVENGDLEKTQSNSTLHEGHGAVQAESVSETAAVVEAAKPEGSDTAKETAESDDAAPSQSSLSNTDQAPKSTSVKLTDDSIVASVNPKKSGYFEFDPDIHVRIRPGLEENMQLLNELRRLVTAEEPVLAANDQWVMSDKALWRYLVARRLDLEGARKQVIASLKWRDFRKPDLLRANDIRIEVETGKVGIRGKDKHGRPVLVFDPSVENTWSAKGNMEGLVYTLSRALKQMEGSVDKYVLIIRLEDTSMFNFSKLPGPAQVKETIKILMTVFAERLGHAIVYKPPGIFTMFLNLFRSLMDAHVLSKAVWVYGDVSDGSQNDKSMTALIGPNWKELFGEGQPRYNKKWTPGYDSPAEWAKILADEEAELKKAVTPNAS